MGTGTPDEIDALLAEQVAYYRALARAYDDHSLQSDSVAAAGREIEAAVDVHAPAGEVLELACGTGSWTARLLRSASRVTAVDSSPEMLQLARERVGDDPRARFICANLFAWAPDRRYDAVFFGFWLSHVPWERFEDFWRLVDDALKSDGKALFVDDGYRTPEELIEGEESSTIERRLDDGSAHRIVKVPHTAEALEGRLRRLGWAITVTQTGGPFFWGTGGRA